MAENEAGSMKLDDQVLEGVSGGREKIGTWFVAVLSDGSQVRLYSYDEAVAYANEHGGGNVQAVSGYLSGRRSS